MVLQCVQHGPMQYFDLSQKRQGMLTDGSEVFIK